MIPRLKTTNLRESSLEARFDAVLLGRLGTEIASIYGDTLRAPLPAALQALIDRLDEALKTKSGRRRDGG